MLDSEKIVSAKAVLKKIKEDLWGEENDNQKRLIDSYVNDHHPEFKNTLTKESFVSLSDEEKMIYILSVDDIRGLASLKCEKFDSTNYEDVAPGLINNINYALDLIKESPGFIGDMREIDVFYYLNLAGADLPRIHFADLETLTQANMMDTNLAGAIFEKVDFSKIKLENANLTDATFNQSKFMEANFDGANLKHAKTEKEDYSTQMRRASFVGANLKHVKFSQVMFVYANFENADFEEADLHESKFFMAKFKGANLKGVNLQRANMDEANFLNADFKDAKLDGCHVRLATNIGFLFKTASKSEFEKLQFFNIEEGDFKDSDSLSEILRTYQSSSEIIFGGASSEEEKSTIRRYIAKSLIRSVNNDDSLNSEAKKILLKTASESPFFGSSKTAKSSTTTNFFKPEEQCEAKDLLLLEIESLDLLNVPMP